MGDDVGLGEVTRRAEPFGELTEEPEIEVDLVIAGTVEGAGRRLREAARRVDGIAEEHNLRALVPTAEQSPPGVLGIAGDRIDKIDHPLFLRAGLDWLS